MDKFIFNFIAGGLRSALGLIAFLLLLILLAGILQMIYPPLLDAAILCTALAALVLLVRAG